jgi:arylsulfatase A-like enzyme
MGNWKAVKRNVDKIPQGLLELYDLSTDFGETTDVATKHPDIVKRMEEIMKEAHTPSEVFPFVFESK